MFKQILAVVLSIFGMSHLPVNKEGKSFLTDDMKAKLTDEYGDKFVTKFEQDLAEAEKDGPVDGKSTEMTELKNQLTKIKADFDAALEDKADLQGKIDILTKEEEKDNPVHVKLQGQGVKTAFKPNMSLVHNRVIDAYFKGDVSAMYSTDTTIDTSELQAEFGKYVSSEKLEILRKITNDLTCTDHMTTVVTDKSEWRASQAEIDSVLQQFVPYWTPTGKVKFSPITIKNFILKVNQPIKPADIIDQYIGYLYDENLTPDKMPIVKYIVDGLILPKLSEDLETAMAIGDFKEFVPAGDGTAAPETAVVDSMDGYLTILKDLKAAADASVTWLLDGVTLTAENIVASVESAVDAVAPKYRNKRMAIHADPDLIRMYNRAYQTKYPNTKNEDKNENRVDFTNFYFVPMEGMIGSKAFFLTPKVNFKHLMSRDHREAKVYMQVQNYDVKVFIEFRKGTGFAMKEAIFAYLPPEAEPGA